MKKPSLTSLLGQVYTGQLTPVMARREILVMMDDIFEEGARAGYDNACWQSVHPEMKGLFEDQREAVLANRLKDEQNV